MDTKIERNSDVIVTVGRCIDTLRDALLTALIIFGIFVLWDLWPQIKQQFASRPIDTVSIGTVSIKLGAEPVAAFRSENLTINAVGGSADLLEKSSLEELTQAQVQGSGHIDLLGVTKGRTYSSDLLLAYLSRLTPKFVIFRNGDVLEAWAYTGLLAAQLHPHDTFTYETLIARVRGLRRETISKTATAREALETMQKLHVDHLPAIDENHHFQFMLSQDDILARVVASVVLAAQAKPAK